MKKNRDAEDWLTDDDFHLGLTDKKDGQSKGAGDSQIPQINLALKILSFFKSIRIQALSDSEKDVLRRRIERSMSAKRTFSNRALWINRSAAAIFIPGLLIVSVWFYRQHSVSEIMSYVHNLNIHDAGNNTLLILGDQNEVPINSDKSEIDYQSNGKSILINKEQQIKNVGDSLRSIFHTVIVPYGKRLNMTLADGTIVWLNSGSTLVYPAYFKPGKREVYLLGEAVFDVANNSNTQFLVNTNDFIVHVTGTVFNVSAYPDDLSSSAVLAEGKIEITNRGGLFSSKILQIDPGTKVVVDPAQKIMSTYQVNPEDYLSWRDGFLLVRGEALSGILRKLSRYYNVEIVLDDQSIVNETFSGRLDLKDSLQEVFTVISRMVPLSVRETNNKLIINSKK